MAGHIYSGPFCPMLLWYYPAPWRMIHCKEALNLLVVLWSIMMPSTKVVLVAHAITMSCSIICCVLKAKIKHFQHLLSTGHQRLLRFLIRIDWFNSGASLMAHIVKNLPIMQETQVWSLGQKGPLDSKIKMNIWTKYHHYLHPTHERMIHKI